MRELTFGPSERPSSYEAYWCVGTRGFVAGSLEPETNRASLNSFEALNNLMTGTDDSGYSDSR